MALCGKLAVLALVLLVQASALLVLAGPMAPVRRGYPAHFWQFACGVVLDSKIDGVIGGIYQPRDGWYIYYIQTFHGERLYRLSRSEVVADYPEALQAIAVAANRQDAAPGVLRAYRVLEEAGPAIRGNPDEFLSRLQESRLSEIKQKDLVRYEYSLSRERDFSTRWACVGRYWLNLLFEAVFFACLTLFAFWPWLRRKGLRSWCVHLGLLPLLLLAPWCLGYAGWTFTSAGPSGGVLYPWVIVWFGGLIPWTPIDTVIVENTAWVLEPISQPLGPMWSISGMGALGPVGAAIIGLGLSGLTWGAFRLTEMWRLGRAGRCGQVAESNRPACGRPFSDES